MSVLGELLEAMHDAPRASSFRGRARRGDDVGLIREALEQSNRRDRSQSVSIFGMGVSDVASATGLQDSDVSFWSSGRSWRIDHGPSRVIGADGRLFRFHPGMGDVVAEGGEPVERFEGFAIYFAPAVWLGSFRFRIVDEAVHAGRDCWHVATESTATSRRSMPMPWITTDVDVELWVDRSTGIVLRFEGRLDGDLASRFEVEELVVDESIEPDVFAFTTPDGSAIRTQAEMRLEHLRRRGVDTSG